MKEEINPPSWIERLLRSLLADDTAESVLGDITEKFQRRVENGSKSVAQLQYIFEGLMLLRLIGFSKRRHRVRSNNLEMMGNYFLVAYRNLKKERVYSTMSVVGMAVGIASVLIIYTYVRFELSYDKFHTAHERIFRITSEFNDDGARVHSARSDARVFNFINEKIAGVNSVVRVMTQSGLVSSDPQMKIRETRFCYVDSSFFSLFTFNALYGSLKTSLEGPFNLVITERAANRYFGTTDVVDRQLTLETDVTKETYNITAVIGNFPQNSHFETDFITPISSLRTHPYYDKGEFDKGGFPPLYLYALMEEPTSITTLNEKVQAAISNDNPAFVNERDRNTKFNVQALDDIHLYSHLESEWEANSFYIYIQAFAALGFFILFIACINFINLATAQAIKRSREIGVRKVFGSLRLQLTVQFLTETLVHVIIAFTVALGLAEFTLRFFLDDILGKNLSVLSLFGLNTILIAIGFILFVSILAGIYPSIYLSRLRPSAVLKGLPVKQGGEILRQGLVTFQVIISCLLITGTIIIVQQVKYFKNIDLGFDKEQVIAIGLMDRYASANFQTFSDRLTAESFVVAAGLSSTVPGRRGAFYGWDIVPEGMTEEQKVNIKTLGVDEGFADAYKLRFIEGRNFSRDITTDPTEAFVINEAAAKMLGWQQPLGKEISLTSYVGGKKIINGKVIGIVKDFNFESLHRNVDPLLIYINKHPWFADNISVRVKPGDVGEYLEKMTQIWRGFHPDKPMEYSFIDEDLDRLYQAETKFSQILSVIAIIAIFISALGIFSLSSYLASRRAKEMSIRKVFGASSRGLLLLQYRQYFILVILANIITIPICIYGAGQWFSSLAYHISLHPGIFGATLAGSICVTLLIITFHTLRVAAASPIDMIRNE